MGSWGEREWGGEYEDDERRDKYDEEKKEEDMRSMWKEAVETPLPPDMIEPQDSSQNLKPSEEEEKDGQVEVEQMITKRGRGRPRKRILIIPSETPAKEEERVGKVVETTIQGLPFHLLKGGGGFNGAPTGKVAKNSKIRSLPGDTPLGLHCPAPGGALGILSVDINHPAPGMPDQVEEDEVTIKRRRGRPRKEITLNREKIEEERETKKSNPTPPAPRIKILPQSTLPMGEVERSGFLGGGGVGEGEEVKRKRGRPRKTPIITKVATLKEKNQNTKKRPGRPRKRVELVNPKHIKVLTKIKPKLSPLLERK